MKRNIVSLVLWIIGFQLIGALMGNITKGNIKSWYVSLTKSPFTPPDITFGIVWTILYVLLAIIGWYLFSNLKDSKLRLPRILFACQMFLNCLWTPIFFCFHLVGLALLTLSLMIIINSLLLKKMLRFHPIIAYGLFSYLVWLCFATYLNGYIWCNL